MTFPTPVRPCRGRAFDDAPAGEESIDLPEHRALARRASAESIVLLRNAPVGDAPLLP